MITNELEFIIVALDFLSLLRGSINLVSKHRAMFGTEKSFLETTVREKE